jgi:hypothetical protein
VKMRNIAQITIAAVSAFGLFGCSNLADPGGSSVSGNARVTGSLFYGTGSPAINARASIIPIAHNPRYDAALPLSYTVTTDRNGNFSFTIPDSGYFNIQATSPDQKAVLIRSVGLFGSTVALPADTLRTTGVLKVAFPDSTDPEAGYVYVPGTSLMADAAGARNGFVFVNGVPAGPIPGVCIVPNGIPSGRVIKPDLVVSPGDTAVILNSGWQHMARLFLNTTARGAGVNGPVFDFPVYIMLAYWNFNFNEARAHGEDVRFAKSDGTLLSHEIGQWDSAKCVAEIWVKADTIFGNNDRQYILMYWGNPDAAGASDGPSVFETADGFQGVWHLADELMTDSSRDATINNYTCAPWFKTASSIRRWNNPIGREFDGTRCVVMPLTASSSLCAPQNGPYTISAWVYVDSPDSLSHLIAGIDRRYSLNLRPVQGSQRWEFITFADTAAAGSSVIDDRAVLYGDWSYLFGVCDGSSQYLYVNGRQVQSPARITPSLASLPRSAQRDFSIGGYVPGNPDSLQNSGFFIGIIDEVRFENVARSADWIRLSYENQQLNDSLVEFKAP